MLKLFLVWRRHFQNGCLREWFSHFAAFQYHLVSFDYFCCWDCTPYQICHHLWEWETGTSPVQLLSCVWLFVTPWTVAHQASLSVTNSWSSSSRWCHPTISSSVVPFSCLQSFSALGSFPSSQFFASGGQRIGSFSFSINPSNEYSGLISFRMDWLDRLAVQGTLKSLLQHHSSKASFLSCSGFFIVQLSHPYMTTGNHRLD